MGSSFTTAPPTSIEKQAALTQQLDSSSRDCAAPGGEAPLPLEHLPQAQKEAQPQVKTPVMVGRWWLCNGSTVSQMGMQPVVSDHCLGASSTPWCLGAWEPGSLDA